MVETISGSTVIYPTLAQISVSTLTHLLVSTHTAHSVSASNKGGGSSTVYIFHL